MKLRAHVHKGRWSGQWRVCIFNGNARVVSTYRRTHAAALTVALTEVGLTTPPEHREAP